jgi:hypothetical protein
MAQVDATVNLLGQTVTGDGRDLVTAVFQLSQIDATGNIRAYVYATTGSPAKGTGSALATSDPVAASTLASLPGSDVTFTFSTPYTLANGTVYAVVVGVSDGGGAYNVIGKDDSPAPTGAGHMTYRVTATWATAASYDCRYSFSA